MDRSALIARYASGAAAIEAALSGITDEELDARPGVGEWTAREIVHHTADAEMRAALRLRQLIAEDDPLIQGYDEPVWAARIPSARPLEPSLLAIRAARLSTVDVIGLLQEEQWSRSGTHTESGPGYTVEKWLEIYAAHCHDHAAQIERARGAVSG